MSTTLERHGAFRARVEERTEARRVDDAERPCPSRVRTSWTACPTRSRKLLGEAGLAVYIVHFSPARETLVATAQSFDHVPHADMRPSRKRQSCSWQACRLASGRGLKSARTGHRHYHAGMLPRYRRLVEKSASRSPEPAANRCAAHGRPGRASTLPIRTVLVARELGAYASGIPPDRRVARAARLRHGRFRAHVGTRRVDAARERARRAPLGGRTRHAGKRAARGSAARVGRGRDLVDALDVPAPGGFRRPEQLTSRF